MKTNRTSSLTILSKTFGQVLRLMPKEKEKKIKAQNKEEVALKDSQACHF